MLCVKATTRLYQSQTCANHGVGALRRHSWEVRGMPIKVELAKGKVAWEVHAIRGPSILIRLYDAYMAARTRLLKVVTKSA